MIRRILRAIGLLPALTTAEQCRALFSTQSRLRHRFDGDPSRHVLKMQR
jgi:hypothetical protein